MRACVHFYTTAAEGRAARSRLGKDFLGRNVRKSRASECEAKLRRVDDAMTPRALLVSLHHRCLALICIRSGARFSFYSLMPLAFR